MQAIRARLVSVALVVMMAAAGAVCQTATTPPATQSGHHFRHLRHHGRHGFMMLPFAHQLDLTDAQRTQMKQIMSQERSTLKPLMQQLSSSRQQLQQMALSGSFDEAAARTVAQQQTQAMTELAVQHARIQSQLVAVLTSDQKTKLNQLMSERQQKMQQRMQQQQQAPAAAPQGQ